MGGTTVENAAGEPLFRTGYSYKAGKETNQTTNQVLVYTTWNPNYSNILSYRYSYDGVGNITKIEDVTNAARTLAEYTYDELGQLTQEKIYNYNGTSATPSSIDTYVYTYDTAGNILSASKNDTVTKTYSYTDTSWCDLLTAVNGTTISYENGNPLNYYNGEKSYSNLTWENGRQLASITVDGSTYTYSYDGDGIRTQKVVDGVTHTYITQNGKVMRETIGTGTTAKVLDFVYDNSGKPFALTYTDGTAEPQTYYYVLNLQGDVVALMTAGRSIVAQYAYNAWGEILSATGDVAEINPIRYRGYYYDTETGFYYLQSRYYDPVNCRFISADTPEISAISAISISDTNLFTYCGNNPVSRADDGGKFWNFVVGAVVGAVVSAVTTAVDAVKEGGWDALSEGETWAKIGVSAAAGAIGGAISASGCPAVGQALASGLLNAGSNIANSLIAGEDIDWASVAVDTIVGAGASLVGSAATKKAGDLAKKTINKGITRVCNAIDNFNSGSRYWKGAAKRGLSIMRDGIRQLNTAQGKASAIGSMVNGAIITVKTLLGG